MKLNNLKSNKFSVSLLGYLGLIPFLGLMTASMVTANNYFAIMAFCYYSAAISAFLAGTFWQYDSKPAKVLIQSNIMILVIFAALIILHIEALASLIILALVFCWALTLDLSLGHIDWYWHLRKNLSAVVVLCHCLLIGFETLF